MAEQNDPSHGMLIFFSGPSGAGKTSITRAILEQLPNAEFSVSATTRPQTAADTDAVDYHFLTDEQFDQRIAHDDFLEYATYAGNRYGTLRSQITSALAQGKRIVLDIDIQGAQQIREAMPDSFGIFILPPSDDALLQRLRDRKREPEDVIQRRFSEAQREMRDARVGNTFDVFITNTDLDDAIAQTLNAINNELSRRAATA
ncbi:MAG: guanylate kinase [Planctomycetota bacterium]|jgi:guanylate kinase